MTQAEWRLWYHLRAHRFLGLKFRRQVPIGPYTADFLCEIAGLIVEVDGGQHADRVEEDAARTRWLNAQGYRVVRFLE
jgi:very-short-patch-repair endonuclease